MVRAGRGWIMFLFGTVLGLLIAAAVVIFDPSFINSAFELGSTIGEYTAQEEDGDAREELIDAAIEAVNYMSEKDWNSLSAIVNPTRGVTFTPLSQVDTDSDLTFLSDEVARFGTDTAKYIWGSSISGEPIEMTPEDFIAGYICNDDYAGAPVIGRDHVIGSGGRAENVDTVYPGCEFIEFYFPNTENKNDWHALKLVFEPVAGEYKLVGVIHSEWTM